jgi:long-chain-fatty-acid--CoA ligase ACSBG
MAKGRDVPDYEVQWRIEPQKPGNCCMLIYTSGTTGNPKGVMISHDNITWTALTAGRLLNINSDDITVSYLPLSHIAAQMLDIALPITFGSSIAFADANALRGTLADTLREIRPTLFLGVPRVWEKFVEKIKSNFSGLAGFKKTVKDWATEIGIEGNVALQEKKDVPWGWWMADVLFFRKIRDALGLDRCRAQYSAAAPIARETLEFMLSINVPVLEIYGMSECTGPQTIALPSIYKTGSTGKSIPGTELKIDPTTGEICYRGRHIFMGYLHDPEKTREAIDGDGWLHSGDVGEIDSDGLLRITGRIKELIITAGGENIPPVLIEDVVKSELPIVSNCMLIGDKRKFLSMLLTLKTDIDQEGQPTDRLTESVRLILQSIGSAAKTVGEAIADPKVCLSGACVMSCW